MTDCLRDAAIGTSDFLLLAIFGDCMVEFFLLLNAGFRPFDPGGGRFGYGDMLLKLTLGYGGSFLPGAVLIEFGD